MKKAEKLLERMRASQAGWNPQDLENLYRSFGFDAREGGKHIIYWHPKYRFLMATVKRGKDLGKGYIRDAIELINKLKLLEEKDDGQ